MLYIQSACLQLRQSRRFLSVGRSTTRESKAGGYSNGSFPKNFDQLKTYEEANRLTTLLINLLEKELI